MFANGLPLVLNVHKKCANVLIGNMPCRTEPEKKRRKTVGQQVDSHFAGQYKPKVCLTESKGTEWVWVVWWWQLQYLRCCIQTIENKNVYEGLLSKLSSLLGDAPNDVLVRSADEVLAALKNESIREAEKRKGMLPC